MANRKTTGVKISEKDELVLKGIKRFMAENGCVPSIRGLADYLNMTPAKIYHHKVKLEAAGRLKPNKNSSIIVNGVTFAEMVPFVGGVVAGLPDVPDDGHGSYVLYENTGGDNNYFALRVSGDSMAQAGILDGDTVIVQYNTEARNNDIVVVEVNGETTCKRFVIDDKTGKKWLKPENPNFKAIEMAPGWLIVGVVVRTMRDYCRSENKVSVN